MRPSTYSRSASEKLVRRYSSTESRMLLRAFLRLPSHALQDLMHGGHDAVFHLLIVGSGEAVVDHALVGFVAALLEHAKGGDIRHHVVGICGNNDAFAAELALDAQNVVDDDFAAQRDQRQIFAELDRLHGIRVMAEYGTALIVELEHGFGMTRAVRIGILQARFKCFARLRRKSELDDLKRCALGTTDALKLFG